MISTAQRSQFKPLSGREIAVGVVLLPLALGLWILKALAGAKSGEGL
jgi:hypothetical protein